MKKIYIPAVLVAAITWFACQDVDDISQQMSASFITEGSRFTELQSAQSIRGEKSVDAIVNWQSALAALGQQLESIDHKYQKLDPSKKQAFASRLQSIKASLDTIYARKAEVRIKVPTWSFESAHSRVENLAQTWAQLENSYRNLYGSSPERPQIQIALEEDSELKDTYNDCVLLFEPYAAGDANCRKAAVEACSRQTKIDCVKEFVLKSIPRFMNSGCSVVSDSPTEPGKKIYYVASWVGEGIQACYSSQPIFK